MNDNKFNWIIIITAVVESILLLFSIILARTINKYFKEKGALKLKNSIYWLTEGIYTLFVVGVSIFPLLGMLGTVIALIDIGSIFETTNAETNSIKSEFFLALTSTEIGIICSIFFKVANALCQSFIENQISKAKKYLIEKGNL